MGLNNNLGKLAEVLTVSGSGRVGLNTISPLSRFHINCGVSDDYGLYINGENRNSISGNLGIGTTTPISRLQSSGTVTIGPWNNASTVGNMQLITGGTSPINNRITYGTDGTGWKFAIGKNQGGTVTDQLVIQTDGNVGIGTTNPGHRLSVAGRIDGQNFGVKQLVLQTTPQSLGLPINANAGGGAYLLLISTHFDAGDSTTANLWMIRCGYSGNNFEAVNILNMKSSAGISFSQVNGILHIAGITNWVANIQIISNNLLF
jgi:hypothetical protein